MDFNCRVGSGATGCYKESFNITGGAVSGEDDMIKWPDDHVPNFSTVSKDFMRKCKILSLRILDALSYGMCLSVSITALSQL